MSGAYLFLVIFLLPVPAAASVPDENGTFSEEMENSLDNESSVNNSSGDDFSDHNFNSTDNREPAPIVLLVQIASHRTPITHPLTWTDFSQAMTPAVLPRIKPSMSSSKMEILQMT